MNLGQVLRPSSATPSTSIDYDQFFHYLVSEFASEEMKGDIPGHIPRIVEKASDAYFEFTQLNPSRRMVENSLQEFCLLNLEKRQINLEFKLGPCNEAI